MKSSLAYLISPHQLFEDVSVITAGANVYIIEEWLFFRQYKFHKQKIAFHRASMKYYEQFLCAKGFTVNYIEAFSDLSDIRKLIAYLAEAGVDKIAYREVTDDWLEQRIDKTCTQLNLSVTSNPSLLFLNSRNDLKGYFDDKDRYFLADFYKQQRIRQNILVDDKAHPIGGRWSFDDENRKKYPKNKEAPPVVFPDENEFYKESFAYTNRFFADHYGMLDHSINYPCTHEQARLWLDQFLDYRFAEFGFYEDAIVAKNHFLHHSLLSPLLNCGLITPGEVIKKVLRFAMTNSVPLNSLEGFVRQLTGWREFVRGVYEKVGVKERTRNFWGFRRKIPDSFYNGTTGIAPVDIIIKKVLSTGYCHHIERLMVMANFMLLCEFDPDDVYRWFMEMFIDAYDWVMVPNVYGMSQFADGGLMSTKPYISGSNYLMKMSDFPEGQWQEIWDGLFWRFIDKHIYFFQSNQRLKVLVGSLNKMTAEKRSQHLIIAEQYLKSLG